MRKYLSIHILLVILFKINSVEVIFHFQGLNILPNIPIHIKRKSESLKDEYQYIHKSKLPTLHFQKSLPRLPIPKLEDTANRYLNALKPILCSSDYVNTERAVMEFISACGRGPALHDSIKEIDKECAHSNYLCQLWLDMYLTNRRSLPVNCNPAILLEKDSRPEFNCQDIRASNLLISSLRFLRSFRDRVLKPEILHADPNKVDRFMFRNVTGILPESKTTKGAQMFNAFPVDMSQFRCLFNFSRLPQTKMDRLYQDERHKHIVVMRRGHFFVFDVLDNNGDILAADEILTCIRHVISLADCCLGDAYPSLGAVTTMDRDRWACVRKYLREYSQINADSLRLIDSAILLLSLDTGCPSTLEQSLHSFLCGDGTNRWFDKSFNLIVNEGGDAGINYEPSWGDGVAIMRYLNEIYKDSTDFPRVNPNTTARGDPAAKVKRLEFTLDCDITDTIEQVKCSHENMIKDVEISTLSFPGLGKKYCHKNKLSSDAILHLATQLAYHKINGLCVANYENCSTALFKFGRTEAIRPCTMESKELCEVMNSCCPPHVQKLRSMLNACSRAHKKLKNEAITGQGFDRHLFAMRAIAEKCDGPSQLPCIFQDIGYETINHNILSSSCLSSPYVQAGTFGPCEKDGYGIGYSLLNDALNVYVTSFRSYSNGSDFINCFKYACEQIVNIINKTR